MESLLPVDVVVALAYAAHPHASHLALQTLSHGFVPPSLADSLRRLTNSRLYNPWTQQLAPGALREFLIHGVPYVFPAQFSSQQAIGVPTAWSAQILGFPFLPYEPGDAVVWPYPRYPLTSGLALEPLDERVPQLALVDVEFYKLAALVETLRVGRARERRMATDMLRNWRAA